MDFNDVSDSIRELYSTLAWPLVALVGGFGILFGLWIGLGFALSGGDEQKRKQAKDRLRYFIIGFIAIFVIAGLTPAVVGLLQSWAQSQPGT
ncbi:MAG: pilin [Firmicutes bacterium]|nr:pilin [Bacillota bacterium]